MNFCEKISFDLDKAQSFFMNLPPFWSTIRTSRLRQFEVSCDVGSGTRGLNRDISDD